MDDLDTDGLALQLVQIKGHLAAGLHTYGLQQHLQLPQSLFGQREGLKDVTALARTAGNFKLGLEAVISGTLNCTLLQLDQLGGELTLRATRVTLNTSHIDFHSSAHSRYLQN